MDLRAKGVTPCAPLSHDQVEVEVEESGSDGTSLPQAISWEGGKGRREEERKEKEGGRKGKEGGREEREGGRKRGKGRREEERKEKEGGTEGGKRRRDGGRARNKL